MTRLLLYSWPDETKISAMYQFLHEKIIPFYNSLKYVTVVMDGMNLFLEHDTLKEWDFLNGVCNGYAHCNNWFSE